MAATLTHALVFSSSEVPLVGASGAISGVLGFYFLWFPRNVVRMLAFLPPFLMQVFEIPARFVLGLYLVWDNLLPLFVSRGGGVAHGAHIGGFIAGGLLAWLMDRRGLQMQPPDIATLADAPAGGDAVRRALVDGRPADAAAAYFALPPSGAQGALDAAQAVELASWLRQNGHSDAALTLLRRAVRTTPRGSGLAELHAAAGLLLLEDLREPTAAYQHLLTALELGPLPRDRGVGPPRAPRHRRASEAARRPAALVPALVRRAGPAPRRVPESGGGRLA